MEAQMTDYANWKVLKSVINYDGDDPEKQAAAKQAYEDMSNAIAWCNENNYTINEDDLYYFTVQIPAPTAEEVRQMRIMYRRQNIDDQTAERSRKQANDTWTADDEAAYLALDAEVTAYIEEHFPYPVEE
jgi:hypothetical protein